MRILFSSDLHGNLIHYRKLLHAATSHSCAAILLGGDLSPRRGELIKTRFPKTTPTAQGEYDNAMRTEAVGLQRDWFVRKLVPLLRDECHLPVYMILGNSDFRANLEEYTSVLRRETGGRVRVLDDECVVLREEERKGKEERFVLVGVPWVPPSPHSLKDGELMDLNSDCNTSTSAPASPRTCAYTRTGLRSSPATLHLDPYTLPLDFTATIESRLAHLAATDPLLTTTHPSRWILMAHSPPFNTACDILKTGERVGSVALREFMTRHGVGVGLHGHVHETVRMAGGQFVDVLEAEGHDNESLKDGEGVSGDAGKRKGRTVCIAAGNTFKEEKVMFVVFDLNEPEKAVRLSA
ncbi:hypothetical protein HK104_009178 [Borealophlyctis nickersoniae]|nr:hypothetical protein HK104_009178 [Borealophlyctis nickersoniae]